MKILVVGGQSSLALVLSPILRRFSEVITAGRRGCDIELDLDWPSEKMKIPNDCDVVINLAAHTGGKGFKEILSAEEINALGSLKLANACANAKIGHLIHISSIYAEVCENHPQYGAYAISKRHGDDLVEIISRQSSMPLTILRPAPIYGPDELFRRHQPLLYALMDKAQRGEEIVFNGKNDALRNYIHSQDVAEIIAAIAQNPVHGRYTCVSPVNLTLSEIAEIATAVFESDSLIRFDPDKPDIYDNSFVPNEEIYQIINYYPRITLKQGLSTEADRWKQRS